MVKTRHKENGIDKENGIFSIHPNSPRVRGWMEKKREGRVVMDGDLCLDLARLEKVKHAGRKIVARCPACAETGGDRKGNHLSILSSGKFGCAAMSGDAEHRRRIFALAGIVKESRRDPEEERRWRERCARERQRTRDRTDLIQRARKQREAIIARYAWEPCDVWENSPQKMDGDLVEDDPAHFLRSLFPPDAILWTGALHESGQEGKHAHRWRTCVEWQHASPQDRIGPMVTPGTWKPGTVSRSGGDVRSTPYTVLDFDGLDGVKPDNPDRLAAHLRASLSITRWIREGLCWRLAAIVWTGGKSLHAWFHHPGAEALQSLRDVGSTLGVDAGLIGHPEHPCRLPGAIHEKTGERSRVLWLQQGRW